LYALFDDSVDDRPEIIRNPYLLLPIFAISLYARHPDPVAMSINLTDIRAQNLTNWALL
jgi:hypothetical protein